MFPLYSLSPFLELKRVKPLCHFFINNLFYKIKSSSFFGVPVDLFLCKVKSRHLPFKPGALM